jgi:CdiI N-terminal domain
VIGLPFSIKFIDEPLEYLSDDVSVPSAIGQITIGDFKEEFAACLYTWSKSGYESQWRRALDHLLAGNGKAALMTEYINPEESTHLRWWPMYRVDETVYFQEHILFFENAPDDFVKLREPFSLDRQFTYVRDRRTTNENGEQLSEWNVSLADVETFASTLKLMR